MRIYTINISEVTSEEGDAKFMNFIEEENLEWWRYLPTMWAIATPNKITTKILVKKIAECYGNIFSLVLEIDIKDVGGMFPAKKSMLTELQKGWSPYAWFKTVKDPSYVPIWERNEKEKV